MIRSGTGWAKLILFGEHAAVYGHPAAGIRLPLRTRIKWTPSAGGPEFPDDQPRQKAVMHRLLTAAAAIPPTGGPLGGIWNRESSIPRSGGFGSSAALCVAAARIFLGEEGSDYSRSVHRLANRLEEQFHGTPSGVDTGLSCHPGCTAWFPRPGDVPEPKALELPPLYLIYGALPRSRTTAASVQELRRGRKRSGRLAGSLEKLGDIARRFVGLAEDAAESPAAFGQRMNGLINASQEVLAGMGLSVPALETLLNLAAGLGLESGKLSGGGMGGAFFLSAPGPAVRDRALVELPVLIEEKGIDLAEPLRALDLGCPGQQIRKERRRFS